MASENETVEKIVNETKFAIDYGNGVLLDLSGKQAVGILDRIESAWRREKELIGSSDWTKCAMCQTNKTGEGYGDIPPPVGYDDECDECEIAKRLRSGKPRTKRNCDTVADFYDAKRKFKDENAKGRANYCRRLCHWLLAPVAEGGEK